MEAKEETTRKLTIQEVNRMRRKHFVLIPVVLISGLLAWVALVFESLPDVVRWAGAAIAIFAVLIFMSKHLKMERELRNGKVQIIRGRITQKKKMGGDSRSPSSGISRGLKPSGSGATYFISIDNRKFNVPASIYTKVQEGDTIEMNYFSRSQFYLGIEVIEKGM
jgi:hypothetical protein